MKTENPKAEPINPEKAAADLDAEIDAIKTIVLAVEPLPSDARGRVFKYLKNRFSKDWPGSYD